MALHIEQILVGGFDENFSYIIHCDDAHQALVVDPSGDFSLLQGHISRLQLEVVGILLTHTHRDHIDALAQAVEEFQAPVFVHEAGATTVPAGDVQIVSDGAEIELGEHLVQVLHTPGHSPDSICFWCPTAVKQPQLISGDTLFIDGCGRTNDDMVAQLYRSLQSLKRLPGETLVLPGHNYGPVAADTLSQQLQSNRFLVAETFPAFCVERLGYTIDT
jgi:glyoxylase-like metal-dependent hydrolase (beta-lactamase superfamily II)